MLWSRIEEKKKFEEWKEEGQIALIAFCVYQCSNSARVSCLMRGMVFTQNSSQLKKVKKDASKKQKNITNKKKV
jgi:hypothetical protein